MPLSAGERSQVYKAEDDAYWQQHAGVPLDVKQRQAAQQQQGISGGLGGRRRLRQQSQPQVDGAELVHEFEGVQAECAVQCFRQGIAGVVVQCTP